MPSHPLTQESPCPHRSPSCPVRFVPRAAGGGHVRRAAGAEGVAAVPRRAAGRLLGSDLADRADRRPLGSGKSTIARHLFGERLYRARAVAGGPGGDRRPGRPADQASHRAVHRRGLQLAAELDQAVSGALERRAVSLRPGPGAGQGRPARRPGGLRRIHQRGGPQRGAGRPRRPSPRGCGAGRSPGGSWPSPATTT